MKQLFFVAVGLVVGFVLARRVDRSQAAQRPVVRAGSAAKAFASAVADGYRSREAELRARPGDHA
ncbi:MULTISPECIES: hypothetical protein [unclassified Curtobacterium]|uniref:hypothetical protein n=1 Tax=unclassified Curtobacterium TaxID=257496 RepID=UPI000DA88036|nr:MULTISPECIES: hypothetical protein [unclassified Curtobacterium]PZE28832.1 hypothetical protein DEI86_03475 [Curtobacterium sp. MCBD17_028]PZE77184.1 hypothetical protein DEI82_04540 [Curtobacterium sp. MCBD17_019]PZF59135.1 hypothetical protein DEI92_08980 [Curtobacterium sp. MCBD17_034]PZF65211.1 hypothetical protein DEI81_03760 [Curtobacterium sp. MCBD17_013]PZM34323.1 hypothetical protein DEI90_09155 [Curtobacterium sp. MCBD17_031]